MPKSGPFPYLIFFSITGPPPPPGPGGEAQPSGFRPDKTRAASFLNGFKNIPGKACVKRVHNNDAFVNVVN